MGMETEPAGLFVLFVATLQIGDVAAASSRRHFKTADPVGHKEHEKCPGIRMVSPTRL